MTREEIERCYEHKRSIRKERCCMILDCYGPDNQRLKLCEEMSELTKEIIKMKLYGYAGGYIEELADVWIMMQQMILTLNAENYRLFQETIDSKLTRQLHRMQEVE